LRETQIISLSGGRELVGVPVRKGHNALRCFPITQVHVMGWWSILPLEGEYNEGISEQSFQELQEFPRRAGLRDLEVTDKTRIKNGSTWLCLQRGFGFIIT